MGLCWNQGKVLSLALPEKASGDTKRKIRQTGDPFLQVIGKNLLVIKGKGGKTDILKKALITLGFSGCANITPM